MLKLCYFSRFCDLHILDMLSTARISPSLFCVGFAYSNTILGLIDGVTLGESLTTLGLVTHL